MFNNVKQSKTQGRRLDLMLNKPCSFLQAGTCWVVLNIYPLEQSLRKLANMFGAISSNKDSIIVFIAMLKSLRFTFDHEELVSSQQEGGLPCSMWGTHVVTVHCLVVDVEFLTCSICIFIKHILHNEFITHSAERIKGQIWYFVLCNKHCSSVPGSDM